MILAREDRAKYEARLREVEEMIELMPERKKIEYQKRLNIKNK